MVNGDVFYCSTVKVTEAFWLRTKAPLLISILSSFFSGFIHLFLFIFSLHMQCITTTIHLRTTCVRIFWRPKVLIITVSAGEEPTFGQEFVAAASNFRKDTLCRKKSSRIDSIFPHYVALTSSLSLSLSPFLVT